MSDLRPEALSWTTLLARWIDFARASVAIPDELDGKPWRASVAAIINLQAVVFALGEVADLPPDEQPYALDKAEVLIRSNTRDLEATWSDRPMPEGLVDLCRDAEAALLAARERGIGDRGSGVGG